MTTRTQGLLLAVLAVLLIRLAVTGEYLRFVTSWMRWPLLVTGVILVVMAIRPAFFWGGMRPSSAPGSAWLLFLPAVVVFAVAPPPLGAFLADRRADQPAALSAPESLWMPRADGPVVLMPGEFAWGAAQANDPMELAGQEVTMSGFVTLKGQDWYLTRLEIACCAADAMVARIRVSGQAAPPRGQWVQVTGTWVQGTGQESGEPATLEADEVVEVEAPLEAYG